MNMNSLSVALYKTSPGILFAPTQSQREVKHSVLQLGGMIIVLKFHQAILKLNTEVYKTVE